MQNNFEAPVLTVIGKTEEVVMGTTLGGVDSPFQSEPDFEFEHDSL